MYTLPTYRYAYSDRTAALMAQLSKWAYIKFEDSQEETTKLSDELDYIGVSLIDTFHDEVIDVQAYIAYSPKHNIVCLVFRGTESTSFTDILTDLKILLKKPKLPNGTSNDIGIHDGFLSAYLAVDTKIKESIKKNGFDVAPFIITGHSAGGGIAIAASLYLDTYVAKLSACYTFGSPRIGNFALNDSLHKVPIYRLWRGIDPVALLPLNIVGLKHVGDDRYINSDGLIVRDPGTFYLMMQYSKCFVTNFWRIFSYHSSELYKTHLLDYALKRNQ